MFFLLRQDLIVVDAKYYIVPGIIGYVKYNFNRLYFIRLVIDMGFSSLLQSSPLYCISTLVVVIMNWNPEHKLDLWLSIGCTPVICFHIFLLTQPSCCQSSSSCWEKRICFLLIYGGCVKLTYRVRF